MNQRPTPLSPRQFVNIDREIRNPEEDFFNWNKQAKTLALLLALPGRPTPITIGIQGDWGSGKTSFINLVLHHIGDKTPGKPTTDAPLADHLAKHIYRLSKNPQPIFAHQPDVNVFVITFDSWVFTQSEWSADYLFPIYIVQVLRDYLVTTGQIKKDGDESKWLERIADMLPKLGGGLAAAGGAAANFMLPGLGVALAGMSHVAGSSLGDWLAQQNAPPQRLNTELVSFKRNFQELVNKLLQTNPEQAVAAKNGKIPDHYNRLIILVDDLDRVPPLTAVNITEKIKLFMDVPGCIFILASDLKIIRAGLREKLGREIGEDEGKNYLDKIVKIQYQVPQLSRQGVLETARYYNRFSGTFPADSASEAQALALLAVFPSIAANPRNLKRVLNNYAFTLDLHDEPGNKSETHFAFRILAVTVLQQHNSKLAKSLYSWLAKGSDQKAIGSNDADAIIQILLSHLQASPESQETHDIKDFVSLMIAQNYTIGDWRSAFTFSTLTPVSD